MVQLGLIIGCVGFATPPPHLQAAFLGRDGPPSVASPRFFVISGAMLCALSALAGIEVAGLDKPHVKAGKKLEEKKHALTPALHEENPHLHAGKKSSCPSGCKLKQSFIAHADPMMKVNGSSQHFWLTEGVMTPLFEWTSPLDESKMAIEGKTFSRASSGNQWFSKFTIKQNGTAVCEVSLDKADSGSMLIKLDGKDVKAGSTARPSASNGIQLSASKSHGGHQVDQESVDVEAGGITARIFSSKAAKFAKEAQQTHYMHLNIQIEGDLGSVPDARGIFAELSGLRPMSAATGALLKQKPKHKPTALGLVAAEGVHDSPEIPGELMLQQTAGPHCFCPPTDAPANATSLASATDAPAASAANESANATAAASLAAVASLASSSKANASRSASHHQIVIAHAHQIADVLFRQDVKWHEKGSRLANFFFNA